MLKSRHSRSVDQLVNVYLIVSSENLRPVAQEVLALAAVADPAELDALRVSYPP